VFFFVGGEWRAAGGRMGGGQGSWSVGAATAHINNDIFLIKNYTALL
jgi:hypothetical protein